MLDRRLRLAPLQMDARQQQARLEITGIQLERDLEMTARIVGAPSFEQQRREPPPEIRIAVLLADRLLERLDGADRVAGVVAGARTLDRWRRPRRRGRGRQAATDVAPRVTAPFTALARPQVGGQLETERRGAIEIGHRTRAIVELAA